MDNSRIPPKRLQKGLSAVPLTHPLIDSTLKWVECEVAELGPTSKHTFPAKVEVQWNTHGHKTETH